MHFEIYRSAAGLRNALSLGEWHWRLVADNHEIIASGEGFKSKQSCLASIELVKGTSQWTRIVEVQPKP